MDEIIKQVNSPERLKELSCKELGAYCDSVRKFIVESVRHSGGHLASSIGAVELAVALHYVFDCPKDKILWDVGHQAYAHKIITGRAENFGALRANGGISGFPKMTESEYDSFTMGHSSTSLSVGLGYARARDTLGEDYNVISVIGDGAFTGGMAFEALNDIGASKAKMIIVLNDNKMSISKNVGAMSEYLAKLRLSKRYNRLKSTVKKGVLGIPLFGSNLYKALVRTKHGVKSVVQSNKMFEQMGIKYYGPIEGHNLANLIEIFKQVKNEDEPVLIHILTQKGKGYPVAASDPTKFHGIVPQGATNEKSFSQVLSDFLCTEGEKNSKITAITAAMSDGTGLTAFAEKFPDRLYDVGIAEQHAVTLAAGLAAGGLKPYFAVYSSFLQRGFDQVLHDVCINNLGVTFLIDRAGAVGADGVTHQGLYDISYLSLIPNLSILAPKDGCEFRQMLEFSLSYDKPLAIRYPKSYLCDSAENGSFEYGKWEILKRSQSGVYVLAVGNRAVCAASGIENANIVSARCIKPLDSEFLQQINRKGNLIITVEDGAKRGGFGQSVLAYLNEIGQNAKVETIGYPDEFLDDFCIEHSLEAAGITESGILSVIKNFGNSIQ
ncbi:1-deoxy-D-xylulose-5-phosphate synthase [Pumilibacter intestinalis]|uniref:1-deoxy-D-xylulose-5-phosphate synthase n=1 Tax=Pumilibacter intestinalis TaxID=2941511 RepID=UPI00203FB459|nr:1-deoxy-D-xylulose-5-phosphate synthase [Pumilibacter intestinalis]